MQIIADEGLTKGEISLERDNDGSELAYKTCLLGLKTQDIASTVVTDLQSIFASEEKSVRLEYGKVSQEILPIECSFCDRRFAYQKYMKKHVKRVHPHMSQGMFCEYCSANFKKSK